MAYGAFGKLCEAVCGTGAAIEPAASSPVHRPWHPNPKPASQSNRLRGVDCVADSFSACARSE
eukprot:scaffold30993_cov242-Isochrysis_galbana.AAC.4